MQVQSWQIAPVFYSMLMAACLVAIAYWVMKDEDYINQLRQQLEKIAKRE
jgi:heme/copper-type cytochrome/quinol oxidase subunit 4